MRHERLRRRLKQSGNAFPWFIVGLILGVPTILMLAKCGFSFAPRICAREVAFGLFSALAHFGAMVGGGWAGFTLSTRTPRPWMGWVAGLAVWIAIGTLLELCGIPMPKSSEFDIDWV